AARMSSTVIATRNRRELYGICRLYSTDSPVTSSPAANPGTPSAAAASKTSWMRASSSNVTVTAWLTCWKTSWSVQRTGTWAMKAATPPPSQPPPCAGSSGQPSQRAGHDRQRREVHLACLLHLLQGRAGAHEARRVRLLPERDGLVHRRARARLAQRVEGDRPQGGVQVVAQGQPGERVPAVAPLQRGD